eukprot:CAMPEP_0117569706 /NCGR_PEP_ID=MMETSP0784-20121206/58801_1 /TAXON_ID=39447 /ORGANISM="" /LENGTH=57 /DNA_ID=CAMNT_0005367697 /DNA_START=437 /DNA_END=610 /DNA_ORIENTATION=+
MTGPRSVIFNSTWPASMSIPTALLTPSAYEQASGISAGSTERVEQYSTLPSDVSLRS